MKHLPGFYLVLVMIFYPARYNYKNRRRVKYSIIVASLTGTADIHDNQHSSFNKQKATKHDNLIFVSLK